MNVNLLNIVKRIVAEPGEGIPGDPVRLKGFFADYAKNEPADLGRVNIAANIKKTN
jgi:hypothetical protein